MPTPASPSELFAIGAPVAEGAQIIVELTVESPAATQETPVFQQLLLVDDTTTLGTVDLAFTVVPNMDPTMTPSTDGDDKKDDELVVSGGRHV